MPGELSAPTANSVSAPLLAQHLFDPADVERAREEIPLGGVSLLRDERAALLVGFDAFGDDARVRALSPSSTSVWTSAAASFDIDDTRDEAAIDL